MGEGLAITLMLYDEFKEIEMGFEDLSGLEQSGLYLDTPAQLRASNRIQHRQTGLDIKSTKIINKTFRCREMYKNYEINVDYSPSNQNPYRIPTEEFSQFENIADNAGVKIAYR